MVQAVRSPLPYYVDLNGLPLQSGYLFFGAVGMNPETSPVTMYWDAALTQPAAQPIRTVNGCPSRNGNPALLYTNTDHSVTVRDSQRRLVYYARDSFELTLESQLANTAQAALGAGMIGYNAALSYAANTVGAALNDIATIMASSAIFYKPEAHGGIQGAINAAAAAGGGVVWLRPGTTYPLAARVEMLDNVTLMSDGTGKLYAPASVFNNSSLAGVYGANAAVINAGGSAITQRRNVKLLNFQIESEVQDARLVDGVIARNVNGLIVDSLEMYGFPVGVGVRASTLFGRCAITRNYIRNFTTAFAWGSQPQISGVEIDGTRLNNNSSIGVVVAYNRIDSLLLTGDAFALYGMQSDGINFQGNRTLTISPNLLAVVSGNVITNVGEGIDTFASNGVYVANLTRDCYDAGMKFIHGASFNLTVAHMAERCGRYGIGVFGSTIPNVGDTDRNLYVACHLTDIDPNNVGFGNPSCVYIEHPSSPTGKPKNTLFSACTLSMGANGEYCWIDTSTGENNIGTDLIMVGGPSEDRKVRVDNGAGAVREAGTTNWISDSDAVIIASAATIAPKNDVSFVSGTAVISGITVPARFAASGGSITLIPTGLWTMTTSGNINNAVTAVVGKALTLTYAPPTARWYPSY